jgi:uncharacterized RDD family membrane protein YckC
VIGTADAARERLGGQVTGTARGVIEELEPYLVEEMAPRLLAALVPHLVEQIVPTIVDGITPHLVATTVPAVVDGVTPALTDELLPVILDRLRPYMQTELIPAVLAAVTPYVVEETAPRIVAGLMPRINAELVPAVLDGVVDDPRIRTLIRTQSMGLMTDAVTRLHRVLADADNRAEAALRRLVRIRAPEDVRTGAPGLNRPAHTHAGIVSRLVAGGLDLLLLTALTAPAMAVVLALAATIRDPVPPTFVETVTVIFALAAPVYFALSWRLAGRTVGAALTGFTVCRQDGTRLRLGRAAARAVLLTTLGVLWAVTLLAGIRDHQRRSWLDRIVGSRTPVDAIPEPPPIALAGRMGSDP